MSADVSESKSSARHPTPVVVSVDDKMNTTTNVSVKIFPGIVGGHFLRTSSRSLKSDTLLTQFWYARRNFRMASIILCVKRV